MDQTFKDRLREIKPNQLIIPLVVLVIFVGALIGIINYQNKNRLNKVPTLEVISPADGAQVSEAQIVVTGKTNSKNKISVNQKNIEVDKGGEFNTEVSLSYGENTIFVIAENLVGKKTEKNIKVNRTGVAVEEPTVVPSSGGETVSQETDVAADGKGNLSTSGPETFWLLESATLSAAGAAWFATRKKFTKTIKKI